MTQGTKEPLYGAATDKCRFCGVAIRKADDCWENAVGGDEEGTLSCEKNPDTARYEAKEEVAPHEPVVSLVTPGPWKTRRKGALVQILGPDDTLVAEVWGPDAPAIAATPDTLAALERIAGAVEKYSEATTAHGATDADIEQAEASMGYALIEARAVLAKAGR